MSKSEVKRKNFQRKRLSKATGVVKGEPKHDTNTISITSNIIGHSVVDTDGRNVPGTADEDKSKEGPEE